MTFGERSRYLRREKEISQIELAKALNISKACISMIEIGKNEPTAATLERYADFFEVSTDYLLGREDDFGNISIKEKNSPSLTLDEQQLLNDFRTLPKPERAQATEYVHYLAERQRRNQKKNA